MPASPRPWAGQHGPEASGVAAQQDEPKRHAASNFNLQRATADNEKVRSIGCAYSGVVEETAVSGQRLSLLAVSAPLPGAPDVRLARDEQVFSPVQVLELCAELDKIDKALGEGSLTTRTARAGSRRR
jgi:hypothetical protein